MVERVFELYIQPPLAAKQVTIIYSLLHTFINGNCQRKMLKDKYKNYRGIRHEFFDSADAM